MPGFTYLILSLDLTFSSHLNCQDTYLVKLDSFGLRLKAIIIVPFALDNVKALFRRGKAHGAVWNMKEAQSDLERAAELDPSIGATVRTTLAAMCADIKQRDELDRHMLQGKMF